MRLPNWSDPATRERLRVITSDMAREILSLVKMYPDDEEGAAEEVVMAAAACIAAASLTNGLPVETMTFVKKLIDAIYAGAIEGSGHKAHGAPSALRS